MEGKSLYSLEVYIKDILNLSLPCGIPAVSFRFLDYPTVLIYFTDLKELESLKKKLIDVSTITTDDCIDPRDLRNQSDGYDFYKGKSCLFSKQFKSLKQLLTEVPLYMTLIDCLQDQPKLLGLCSLSLLSLIQNIETIKTQSFEDSPAVSSENFSVSICNLMGTKIANLNINIKLTCFGSSLLRHVTMEENKNSQINIIMQNLSVNDEKVFRNVEKDPIEHCIIPADGKPSESKVKKKGFHLSSQCSPMKKSRKKLQTRARQSLVSNQHYNRANLNEENSNTNIDNTVRPPPLFLNLNENDNAVVLTHFTKQQQSSKYLLETKFEEFDEISSDEEAVIETLVPVKGKSNIYKLLSEVKPDTHGRDNGIIELPKKNYTKENNMKNVRTYASEMPVLCSLLKEISKLNDFINGPIEMEENTKIEPKVNESAHQNNNNNINGNKSHIAKHLLSHLRMDKHNESILAEDENKRSTTKDCKLSNPKPKTVIKHVSNLHQEPLIKDRKKGKSKLKQKSGKRNTYGLTRTQRLRYAITHEGKDPLKLQCKFQNENVAASNAEGRKKDNPLKADFPKNYTDPVQETDVSLEEKPMETKQKINIRLPTPTHDVPSSATEEVPSHEDDNVKNIVRTESKVGFYSPEEPRQLTWSQLGDFNDNQRWSSDNGAVKPSAEKDLRSYSEESFVSDNESDRNTITGTSSISIPFVSRVSNESPIAPPPSNDGKTPSPVKSERSPHRVRSSPVKSDRSPQRVRSSSRMTSRIESRNSQLSEANKQRSSTRNSTNTLKSTERSFSSFSNSSSSFSSSSKQSKSTNSTSSKPSAANEPRVSAWSPVQSNYNKKHTSQLEPSNRLDITLPTVDPSSLLSSNNSEYKSSN